MSLKGVFKSLITLVICVAIGAFILKVILPNVSAGACNVIENGIKSATGVSFDLNGDGVGGSKADAKDEDGIVTDGVDVEGFDGISGD